MLGLEYNPVVEEIGPRLSWEPIPESKYVPKIAFGTSSDRIGSPKGKQCYYVTFGKSLPRLPVAPYASVNYSEWDERLNFPFGANIQLHRRWSVIPMNDGRKPHLIANFAGDFFSVSALWIWFERAGVGLTVGM